jgi:hypothetical protein
MDDPAAYLALVELHHYVHSSNFSAYTWQNAGNVVMCPS